MSKIIISGSTAYDNIMYSNSNIKNHLVEKKIWNVNLSYVISDLKEEVWWTWLNISYNLSLLWTEPILFSSIWNDFTFSDFIKENVDLGYVNVSKDKLTSRSYITNDSSNNQVTAFYPWSMSDTCDITKLKNNESVEYSIVSANNVNSMKQHLEFLSNKWVKTLFDPGQQITQMTKSDLEYCFKYSNYIILNEYEYEVIKKISEKSDWEMIDSFDYMVLTYWVKGSKIFDRNYNILEVHWVENPDFKDPTWAWDAYRAWLLKGLNDWYDWETSARIWAVLSSISTSKYWAQNHVIDWKKFSKLYEQTFWDSLEK